jgi:uncharacterized protein YjbI with pentapeptide repeats
MERRHRVVTAVVGGAIDDLDVEVKWGCPCEEFCLDRDGCVLEVEVMTAEELLERYAAGERDFSGVDLQGVRLADKDLRGIILRNANLRGSYLAGTDFDRADFSDADLSKARLESTGFIEANLTKADLRECYCLQTPFFDANLSYANFTKAFLEETSFGGANLSHTDFSQATRFDIDGRCTGAIFCETILPTGSVRTDQT